MFYLHVLLYFVGSSEIEDIPDLYRDYVSSLEADTAREGYGDEGEMEKEDNGDS